MFYKGKKTTLERKLGAFDLLLFGFGNILGPQIFLMLSGLVMISGEHGLFSIMIGSVICFLIAGVYLELALSMPTASFVLDSITDAYGEFMSFLVGWSMLFGNVTFAAMCGIGFGMFLGDAMLGGLASIIVITLLEFRGITEIGKFQLALVFLIIGFFAVLIAFNFPSDAPQISLQAEFHSIKSILFGIGFFFLAFTGFEDLTTYAEEVKDVRKLPRVMFLLLFLISVLYISLYFVLIAGIRGGDELLLSDPLMFLSKRIFGTLSDNIIGIIGMSAAISSLITSKNTCTRNVYSMAQKGFLPEVFADVKKDIPFFAILLSSALTLLVLMSGSLEIIVYLSNFLYFFIAATLSFALLKLREKRKKLERPFRLPLAPVLATLTGYLMIGLIGFLELRSIALGIAWIFFGFIIYMLRVVGEYRLKIALLGANMVCSLLLVIVFFVLQDVSPALFLRTKPALLVSMLLFLVFSAILLIDTVGVKGKMNENLVGAYGIRPKR